MNIKIEFYNCVPGYGPLPENEEIKQGDIWVSFFPSEGKPIHHSCAGSVGFTPSGYYEIMGYTSDKGWPYRYGLKMPNCENRLPPNTNYAKPLPLP